MPTNSMENTKTKQASGMRQSERDRERTKPMEDCMRDCMRKLALLLTRTFKPITTHKELEPIMATLGFVGLPPFSLSSSSSSVSSSEDDDGGVVAWKEYVYPAGGWLSVSPIELQTPPPPKPRLPYPEIGGLHVYTYWAFLDAVNFYLEMINISDLFHIRGMPLHRVHDRSMKWRRMEQDDSIFVYREGTLDQAIYSFYRKNKKNIDTSSSKSSSKGWNSMLIRNQGNNTPTGCLVPLKDIITLL